MRTIDEGGSHMTGSYDPLSAALADLELLTGDLHGVSAQLQELATVSQRINLPGALRLEPGSPGSLRDATARLVATARTLVDAGPDHPSGLAFSAVAQMSALDAGVRAAIAAVSGSRYPDAAANGGTSGAGTWGTLQITLNRASKRLRGLISHLAQAGNGR
jgi:hypothetical protein